MMGIGLGRRRRKRKGRKEKGQALSPSRYGSRAICSGSQKGRKAARKRPHRCYIHIHQIKSHISTRFFSCSEGPPHPPPVLLNLPTGYLDNHHPCVLQTSSPVPSTQSWLMHAFLHLSSPSHQKHTCELSSPFTEHSRLSESRSHATPA